MKSWELTDKLCDAELKSALELFGKEDKYLAGYGRLRSVIGSIFIRLEVSYPEAFLHILESLNLTR